MISLIHPSRLRPDKSFHNASKWLNLAKTKCQLILAIDSDDPTAPRYKELYNTLHDSEHEIGILHDKHLSVVHATNMAAAKSTGDILIYLSDDFDCPNDWQWLVLNEFEKYSGPTLIKVDDCLQRFDVPVLTIPMMNRELYDKLGYFFHPGYKSMFVDEHLYWRTQRLKALRFAPQLKFEHKHVSVGKAQDDETYRRSAANWDQGKALFAQHKAAGFPV